MQRGDTRARDALVLGHMRLVIAVARRARVEGGEDLIAEATLGLLEAIDRFEPMRRVRLATYAVPWIRMRAWRWVLANQRAVAAPDTRRARRVFARLGRVERRLIGTTGQASADRIAEEIGVDVRDVEQVLLALRDRDSPVSGSEDGSLDLADWRANPEEAVADVEERRVLAAAVSRAVSALPVRERTIVECRMLHSERKRSLRSLGAAFQVSGEWVRRLEARALERLGRELGDLR